VQRRELRITVKRRTATINLLIEEVDRNTVKWAKEMERGNKQKCEKEGG
jgi:hypothetical protein